MRRLSWCVVAGLLALGAPAARAADGSAYGGMCVMVTVPDPGHPR